MIKINQLVDEDFINYYKSSMFIAFPHCNFKCGKENCHNWQLEKSELIEIEEKEIVKRFINNSLTEAFVFGGLDPLDTFEDTIKLITAIRKEIQSDIVIYTGYNFNEKPTEQLINFVKENSFNNIYLKVGRYIPKQKPHFDNVLKINLASDNQYGVQIS